MQIAIMLRWRTTMNNSVNYANFIALLMKNNENEFYDVTTNSDNYTPKENKLHHDKKQQPKHITSVEQWLGE